MSDLTPQQLKTLHAARKSHGFFGEPISLDADGLELIRLGYATFLPGSAVGLYTSKSGDELLKLEEQKRKIVQHDR